MMSIVYVFWMYVILFSIIGALRGWVKELIVACSVITALAVNYLLRQYFPYFDPKVMNIDDPALFWVRTGVVIALAFFGYQTVGIVPHLAPKAKPGESGRRLLGHGGRRYQWLFDRRHYFVLLHQRCPLSISRYHREACRAGLRLDSNFDDVHAAALVGRTRGFISRLFFV